MPNVEETAIARMRQLESGEPPAAAARIDPVRSVRQWHARLRNGTTAQRVGIWAVTVIVGAIAIAAAILFTYFAVVTVMFFAVLYVFWWALSAYLLTSSAREKSLRKLRGKASGRR